MVWHRRRLRITYEVYDMVGREWVLLRLKEGADWRGCITMRAAACWNLRKIGGELSTALNGPLMPEL